MSFSLHPSLAADSVVVGELPLCTVLLMNNRHFPWLVLVPKREGMREWFDLADADYTTSLQEVRTLAKRFGEVMKADKMNIAALGNITPQLHIHVIARFEGDHAWPMPIWNKLDAPAPYESKSLDEMLVKVRAALASL